MADTLTRNQTELLKELKAAGEHGRILRLATSMTRTEVMQLIAMGYIKPLRHSQHFVITERGQEALVTTEDR